MTLYWIKYGKNQPNPQIKKQIDKIFLDYNNLNNSQDGKKEE